ncbi:RRM (2xRRMs) domaincontaining [Cryptosporidium xiaoi]|uniref:RRM (2xRRMs) domaincontaining n=1 Tax=Cryptosporidium xiaoi TaxID=659607 RepID=A0AAV9XW88_9CRYT
MIENSVFIRNISPLANKDSVLEIFSDIKEEILTVEFHRYPNSEQKFCQIFFKSSNGVTKSTAYNGSTLLGVPMSITVLPPVQINNYEQNKITSNKEVFVKGVPKNYSDWKIISLFELDGEVPIKITRIENSTPFKMNLIIEFMNETTTQKLLELKNIYTDDGDLIEISNTYSSNSLQNNNNDIDYNGTINNNMSLLSSSNIVSTTPVYGTPSKSNAASSIVRVLSNNSNKTNVVSSTSNYNPTSENASIDLSNISVPLAYQQIKKVEWDNKLSKLFEIKKKIENRILNTDSKVKDEFCSSSCGYSNKDFSRRRSLSRSLSPVL